MTTSSRAPSALGSRLTRRLTCLPALPDQRGVEVGHLVGGLAVHGEDVLAGLDVDADLGQRRAQALVPVLAGQDAR